MPVFIFFSLELKPNRITDVEDKNSIRIKIQFARTDADSEQKMRISSSASIAANLYVSGRTFLHQAATMS